VRQCAVGIGGGHREDHGVLCRVVDELGGEVALPRVGAGSAEEGRRSIGCADALLDLQLVAPLILEALPPAFLTDLVRGHHVDCSGREDSYAVEFTAVEKHLCQLVIVMGCAMQASGAGEVCSVG